MDTQKNSIVRSRSRRYAALLMMIIAALWVPYVTQASSTVESSMAAPNRQSHVDETSGAATLTNDSGANLNSMCNPYIPGGAYQQTCRNIRVTLSAECQKADGSWPTTSLDLTTLSNAEVENADGTLRVVGPSGAPLQGYIPNGSYQQTCRNIRVTLSAECQKANGLWRATSLDLTTLSNADVVNSDGQLFAR